MKKVVFICLGNICRSPMAEAIFRDLVKQQNLEAAFTIDSAGTAGWHEGERPHKGTLAKLKEYGISTEGMYSRPLTKEDGERFDYFICMDESNVENTRRILGGDKEVLRLLDLTTHTVKEVPDPYYTGDFEETYQLCLEGCTKLLEKLC